MCKLMIFLMRQIRKLYSVWKGMGEYDRSIFRLGSRNRRKEKKKFILFLLIERWKKSLICIEKGWKEALIRGMF